jgi:phosphoesterase RecJ-like protein
LDSHKSEKLGHAIQKVLSELLQKEVKDPRVGFVTVSGVKLNRDQSVAQVYCSIIGDEQERERSLAGLRKAAGFLQSRLARVLRLRQTPELRFLYDESIERGLEVDSILRGLAERGEFAGEAGRRRSLLLDDLVPPRDLIEGLTAAERPWIVPHANPDADAVGSALALGAALEAAGKRPVVLAFPESPPGIPELPGYDRTLQPDEAAELLPEEPPDAVVLVDSHRLDRTGVYEEMLESVEQFWVIDHHLLGSQAPLPGWVDDRACSTATLVHQVICALQTGLEGRCTSFEMDPEIASCLYAGLINDTGGFRFPNTLPMTFELARRLTLAGADPAASAKRTLHRYRRQGVDLLREVLGTFSYAAEGRVLTLRVDQEMLARTGAGLGDTETFVNVAASVEGVAYVALMKEVEAGTWRLSLRAPGGGNVQQVATRHGGGGHHQAAGCTLEGSAEEVQRTIVADLTASLDGDRP